MTWSINNRSVACGVDNQCLRIDNHNLKNSSDGTISTKQLWKNNLTSKGYSYEAFNKNDSCSLYLQNFKSE